MIEELLLLEILPAAFVAHWGATIIQGLTSLNAQRMFLPTLSLAAVKFKTMLMFELHNSLILLEHASLQVFEAIVTL